MINLREMPLPHVAGQERCYVVSESQLREAESSQPCLREDAVIRIVRFADLAEGAEFILCQGAGGAGRRFRKKSEGDFTAEWATNDGMGETMDGYRCHVGPGAPCLVGVDEVRELAWLRKEARKREEGSATRAASEKADQDALQACKDALPGETWRAVAERLLRERGQQLPLLKLLVAKRDYMREPRDGAERPSELAYAYANGVDFAVDCLEGHWTVKSFDAWCRKVGRIRDGVDVGRLLSEAVAKLPPGEVLAEVSVSPSTWRVGELAPTSFELLLSTLKREGEATWRSEHRVVGDGKPVLVETRREA